MTEKVTFKIGGSAKVETWRDGEWTILYVEDGGGGRATVSLPISNALDIAEMIRAHAVTASTKLSGQPEMSISRASKGLSGNGCGSTQSGRFGGGRS